MKHVVQGIAYIFFIVMTVVIIMTIYGRVDRSSNLQSSLQSAVKGAVDEVSTRGGYSSENIDDLKADFVSRLCTNLDISGDTSDAGDSTAVHDDNLALQIDFTDSSIEEGLLGVHVTERITYPHGKESVIEASAVVILEDEGDKQQCRITYLLTDGAQEQLGFPSPYKVYSAVKDEGAKKSLIPVPSSEVRKWVPLEDYPDYGITAGSALSCDEIEKIPVPGDITFIDDGSVNPTEVPYEAVALKECIPNTYDVDKVIDFDKGNHDFVIKLVPGTLVRYNGSVYEVAEEPYKDTSTAGLTVRPAVPHYDGFITPKQTSLYLVKEDEIANNVIYFFFDRQKYNLTVHVDENIVSATADVGKYKEISCPPNDTSIIGSIYYGTEIDFTVKSEDGFRYTFSGDADSENFIMPDRDAEIWINSTESKYNLRLNPNGGTFQYTEDANGSIKVKDASDTSSLIDMSFIHNYTDDWTLPWVDSDNRAKSNGNNGIKNQTTALMYRDGYVFEGWTDIAPSKDVYNNFDNMSLSAFKEYVKSKGGHFYNDVAEVSTKDFSEDNVCTKGTPDKGEIRLYAKWRLQYFVVRYHSDTLNDSDFESDMDIPKGKTAIDTNNGKFYEMAKDGTYPSVWLADNTLGEGRIRTALGFDENSNADFSSWTVGGDGNPDKDNFSIGVTVADGERKESDLYTELDGTGRKHFKAMEGDNNVPGGTITTPSGLASYISHSSTAKAEWVNGRYVMVIDLYPTYTYALKVNLHGNASKYGIDYESSFYAHYAVENAYSVPDMTSYNNSSATFKGRFDIAKAGSPEKFDGSLNPYLSRLKISETRRCWYLPKEGDNAAPYRWADFYWSANGGTTLDLYAQWNITNNTNPSKKPYTVVFTDPDGSKAQSYSQTMWPDVTTALLGNKFSMPGYAFAGWVKTDGDDWTFNGGDNYTSTQTFTVPKDGYYFIEAYGAKGGDVWSNQNGGVGGYTYIRVYLAKGQTVSMNVGHAGGWQGDYDARNGWPDGSPSMYSTEVWKAKYNDSTVRRPVGGGSTSVFVDGTKIAQAGGGGAGSSGDTNTYVSGKDGNVAGHPGNDTDNSPYIYYNENGRQYSWNHSYGNGTRNDSERNSNNADWQHGDWRYPAAHFWMGSFGGGGGGGYVNGYAGFVQPYWKIADYTNKYSNTAKYSVVDSLTFGCDSYYPDRVNKTYNTNGGNVLAAAHGGTGYVVGGTSVGTDIQGSFNNHVTYGKIVKGSTSIYNNANGIVRIRYIYADKQEVLNLAPEGGTVTLKAVWSTSPFSSFSFKTSNIRTDMMELETYKYLQAYTKGISEVPYSSKAYTLPDLGEENGFMGWYCESGDIAGTYVGRTYTLPKGSTGTWRFRALWMDHYAVSIWDMNHNDGLNPGGIVFGSAMNTTNNDYDISYIGNSPSRHVHDGECIHNDYVQGGWARVIYYCQNDPERYRKCMDYGCTVPVYFYGKNGARYGGKAIYTALTKLGGDIGIGDGATQLDYNVYQSKGNDDTDHDTGGWRNASGGKNKEYTAYDNSDMPDKMDELYGALCNSDLKSYISDSTVRFATQSKSYVKGLWDSDAAAGRFNVIAPVTINSDGTTTPKSETIGANFIEDLRPGAEGFRTVEVYNYRTLSGQKFFLPSAHEIYGSQTDGNSCKLFMSGYTQKDTAYVLDYLDGTQYEKFKDYSFNGNLFIASYGTKYGVKKDNARLNTQNAFGNHNVVLRTPGSSNTRARVTYLYSDGGLNTAGFTTNDYAVTPCFRIKK